jgi:hypothetical protein
MYSHSNEELRFTLDGNEGLERHLRRICRRVRDELTALVPAAQLRGLLLGGGYGRGEGGVLRSAEGDRPYNDLEFYVLLAGVGRLARRRLDRALHRVHASLSALNGIEIEFKLLPLDALRRGGPTMFSYDLVMGHRWLVGDDSLLEGCEHHCDATRIPLSEATRLWMNRATGLLFAGERLRRPSFGTEEADFVGRNLAKARLACGDIVLTVLGQYHWSCRERNRRLHALEARATPLDLSELVRYHDAGVEFKLHPVRSTESREALAPQHASLVRLAGELLLWLENRRLGTAFRSLRDYARSGANKCPETTAAKNWLLTALALGPGAALSAGAFRYPRERLLDSLALLLGGGFADLSAGDLVFLQHRLHTGAGDLAGLVAAHETLWRRFG